MRRSASISVSISPVYSAINVPRGIFISPRTPKPLTRSLHSNTCSATFDPFWTTRFLHNNLLQPHTSLHSNIIAGSWKLKSLFRRPSALYQFCMDISLHWQFCVVQLQTINDNDECKWILFLVNNCEHEYSLVETGAYTHLWYASIDLYGILQQNRFCDVLEVGNQLIAIAVALRGRWTWISVLFAADNLNRIHLATIWYVSTRTS